MPKFTIKFMFQISYKWRRWITLRQFCKKVPLKPCFNIKNNMKTTLLIFLGFTILVVTLAAKPKKNARDVGQSATEDKQKEGNTTAKNQEPELADEAEGDEVSNGSGSADKPEEDNKKNKGKSKRKPKPSENRSENAPASTRKSKKNSKPESAKKSTKKASKKEVDDIISEDLEDILKDNSVEDEVEIPSAEELTTESNPIELGEQIKNLTDKKKRRALIAQLKSAINENKGTLPEKFYRAVYASLINTEEAVEEAEKFWNKNLKEATEKVMNAGKDIVDKGNAGLANVGLGDALGNARKIAQIDPLGIALRRGESVLLTALSESLKNLGKLTDFTYDATKNASRFVRAATFPVDFIPIASEIKNNFHDLIEEGADRGKYLSGSFTDNGATALGNAAKNAGRKADEKGELLRQFTSARKI